MSKTPTALFPEISSLKKFFVEEYMHSNDHDALEQEIELTRSRLQGVTLSRKEQALLDYFEMKARFYTRGEFPSVDRLDEMVAIGLIPAIDYRMKILDIEPANEDLRTLLNEQVQIIIESNNIDIKMYSLDAIRRANLGSKTLSTDINYIREIYNLCVKNNYGSFAITTKNQTGRVCLNSFSTKECKRLIEVLGVVRNKIENNTIRGERFIIGKRHFVATDVNNIETTFMLYKSNQLVSSFQIKANYDSGEIAEISLKESKATLDIMIRDINSQLGKSSIVLDPLFTDEL